MATPVKNSSPLRKSSMKQGRHNFSPYAREGSYKASRDPDLGMYGS